MKQRILTFLYACSLPFAGMFSSLAWSDEKPSVTVFPVVATPERFPDDFAERVGRVIATFLEKAGLDELDVAATVFVPPESDNVQEIAAAFGRHVGQHPIQTDGAVFAQFMGTPQTGVQGIRTVVVDASGKVLLAESAGEAEFKKAGIRPQDPMTCCAFVSRRLQQFWKLDDPLRADAPEGKMARFWRQDAGIPDQVELNAISTRWDTMKANLKTATFTVYPVRVGSQADQQCATALAALFNEHDIGTSEVSATDLDLKIAGHSNEQKVLWDTARAFRKFIRDHRPVTDYAIYADYGLYGGQVRYVHVVACDQAGDWVWIAMQNSHHADFQRIDPQSADDCHRLVLAMWRSQRPD